MQTSFTINYIKIYIWQGVSLLLNFLSMFIVLPYLTNKPEIFGIYSVCISVSIFLSYADLGFMGAGQKYAAEHFARGETNQEIHVIGFTSFILVIFLLLFSMVLFYLSLHPWVLIKNLTAGEESWIASALLMILALSTPVTFLQRVAQMIFGIRLEGYVIQRTNIIASLISILSVLWFFNNEQYHIVGYFFFVQMVNLLAAIISWIIALNRYNYNFKLLTTSIRFSKALFSKTKKLAFTSLYIIFTLILYYELDPAIIGKFIGAKQVAIYAIGLSLLSFFRSILGILFSPFNSRFNHFIGVKDMAGLKAFYLHIIIILAPLVVLPILTTTLLAKPLILSWVGINYAESVEIAKYLVLCNLFAFITYPTGMLLVAEERINVMNVVATLLPVVYWSGIVLTYSFFGLKSFAIFKLVIFGILVMVYYVITLKFLNMNFTQLSKEILAPILLPAIFIMVTAVIIEGFLPCEKSKLNLLIVTTTAGCLIFISFILQYFSSARIRRYTSKILQQW
jgi:O-antigen/teichoic acid export membrane protein